MRDVLPYYKAYPRDFIEGTVGMPFEEKGAYRIIIDLIYMQSGNLPDDARYISGLLGCSVRKWKNIRKFLIDAEKIHVIGDFLTNYRAVSELETLGKFQDKQRENRAGSNKNKGLAKPKGDQPEPEPEPKKKENLIKEFDAFWKAYPKRQGSNPKEPAKQKFFNHCNDVDPKIIIAGTESYAAQEIDNIGSKYITQAVTWLNQKRWMDDYLLPQQKKKKLSENLSDWMDV